MIAPKFHCKTNYYMLAPISYKENWVRMSNNGTLILVITLQWRSAEIKDIFIFRPGTLYVKIWRKKYYCMTSLCDPRWVFQLKSVQAQKKLLKMKKKKEIPLDNMSIFRRGHMLIISAICSLQLWFHKDDLI